MDPIIRRILAELGAPDLVETLGERLSASDLQSLLLHVMHRRAGRVSASEVLAQGERAALTWPSSLGARVALAIDQAAFSAAADFEAIDLSPVAPLGIDAVLGRIHTNNVLTAVRPVQALADPTSAMALEAARRRRRQRSAEPIHLCASQRCIRLQPTDLPGYTPHFRLFGLVTAGRDIGSDGFELTALAVHLRTYLRLFRLLAAQGFAFPDVEVTASDTSVIRELLRLQGIGSERLASVHVHYPASVARFLEENRVTLPRDILDQAADLPPLEDKPAAAAAQRLARVRREVFAPLAAEFPEAQWRIDGSRLAGLSYYTGLCLQIWARDCDGVHHALADGGMTSWTAELLNDRKERLLASGIGTEFIGKRYGDQHSAKASSG